jgi:hypothetical protein
LANPTFVGTNRSNRRKNRQITRFYRIHQLHLITGKGFWFYENLTGNIRDLTGFGKPDICGNEPVQQKEKPANYQILSDSSIASNYRYSCPCRTSPNKPGSTITNGEQQIIRTLRRKTARQTTTLIQNEQPQQSRPQ